MRDELYVEFISEACQDHPENIPKSFPKHGKSFPNCGQIIPKSAQAMHKTFPQHAQVMRKACPSHPLIMLKSKCLKRLKNVAPLAGPSPLQNLTVRAPPWETMFLNCYPPKHSSKVSSSRFGVVLAYTCMNKSYFRRKKLTFFETSVFSNEISFETNI